MTYFLLSLSCFSSSLASSAVLTRISMHIGFLFSSSLSTGGFGTQLNDTLVLPWRFVGMLLVSEMFSRMLPVNIQLTFSQVYNPLLPEPINLGLTWSKFPGFQHWKNVSGERLFKVHESCVFSITYCPSQSKQDWRLLWSVLSHHCLLSEDDRQTLCQSLRAVWHYHYH